jgi:hypothetical protein
MSKKVKRKGKRAPKRESRAHLEERLKMLHAARDTEARETQAKLDQDTVNTWLTQFESVPIPGNMAAVAACVDHAGRTHTLMLPIRGMQEFAAAVRRLLRMPQRETT